MNSNLTRTLQSIDDWNRHDLESYRALYAPQAVLHGLAPVSVDVDRALDGYRAFYTGFPDIRIDVLDSLIEAERIAMRFRITGTHTGNFQGIPATGRSMDAQGITILHFSEGKVIERWNQLDQMGLMQQLGVIPTPGQ